MAHIDATWFEVLAGGHATCLKRTAPLSANVTFNPGRGRIVHLNSEGEWEMGVNATAATIQVPYIIDRGPDTLDGYLPDTLSPSTDKYAWVGQIGEERLVTAACLLGDYEFEITEFNPEGTVGAYAINDTLTAATGNSDATLGGLVTKAGAWNTKPVIGVVTSAVYAAVEGGPSVLRFVSMYYPRRTSA